MRRIALAALAAIALPAAARAAADTYNIDKVHSSLLFKAHHMGAGYVWGILSDVSGTVTFDAANPAADAIDLTAKVDSLTTHDPKRDQHLKSPDFFNAKQFPNITFKSKSVTKVDDKTFNVVGDLTMHGVTKPLTAKVTHTGSAKDPTGASLIGFESTFTIKRADFGMTFMNPNGEDEISVIVAVEGKK
jgi:polyisoprenoid-binding protein YceI